MKRAFKKFKRQLSGDRLRSSSNATKGQNKLHGLRRASSIDVLNACDHSNERAVDEVLSDGHDINALYLGKLVESRIFLLET